MLSWPPDCDVFFPAAPFTALNMEQSLDVWSPTGEEPWPWALSFVLLGWVGLLWLLGHLCAACCGQIKKGTRWAMETERACWDHSGTSCRARLPVGSTPTGEKPKGGATSVETQTEESPLGSERLRTSPVRHRCGPKCPVRVDTPRKEGCVYSSHPRQLGSPDLVKAMACRAGPVMRDLAKGNRSASWEGESCHPGA